MFSIDFNHEFSFSGLEKTKIKKDSDKEKRILCLPTNELSEARKTFADRQRIREERKKLYTKIPGTYVVFI